MTAKITVQNLSKTFHRYHTNRPRTLQEAVLQGLRKLKPAERFQALDDVNFTIEPGQMVGMIGANGAGKSTLLRLIGGVGKPDQGHIKINGRIGALLDLGAGFHPDLTGRENVFISGVISGLTRREVEAQFDNIVEFAELEEFIDHPLRTYSTGMKMRLAFAVAVHIDPEVLLIDEVLAVGDIAFQKKCMTRINEFKERGCAILLVSHDADQVKQLCDKAIWLRKGRVEAHGPADLVVEQYKTAMSKETKQKTPPKMPTVITPNGTELQINENRFGSMEMQIEIVRLFDSTGMAATQIESGSSLDVEIEYLALNPIDAPIFGITITRHDGLVCYDTNTASAGIDMPSVSGRGHIRLQLERLDLNNGQYYIDVGIYEGNWAYTYDYHWHAYSLQINDTLNQKGVLSSPHQWKIEKPVVMPKHR